MAVGSRRSESRTEILAIILGHRKHCLLAILALYQLPGRHPIPRSSTAICLFTPHHGGCHSGIDSRCGKLLEFAGECWGSPIFRCLATRSSTLEAIEGRGIHHFSALILTPPTVAHLLSITGFAKETPVHTIWIVGTWAVDCQSVLRL